ncbi:ThuA domain-containing protein [Mucilaginibacter sp. UR6-11]|uniref:ThuA domain-containing protein n=1 Tax=Mucilaginibacter sp. UR6-11 TaxID=1435644 RepID=UPI001E4ED537|nr:ThuA domain-containing protein [Mucilaginibacter sp. UR6-11]MCC8426534.1 ThuA domain-containing protein [Mucilaginibacter sp. UR6-11]
MQTILVLKNCRVIAGLIVISLLSVSCVSYSQPKPIRVLIVGGGTSHDFDRWYKQADAATLRSDGLCRVTYTSNTDSIGTYLKNTDVLYLVTNQPINAENRDAIFAFANAGKGLILGHPALWYNWKDWPEYNLQLVSGGANEHDRYDSFTEDIVNPNHAVIKGVEQQFTLKDERYHYIPDPAGPGIEILADNHVAGSAIVYPSVFIVKNKKARIVCIALGHDAGSHDITPYQTILRNAVKWAAHQ